MTFLFASRLLTMRVAPLCRSCDYTPPSGFIIQCQKISRHPFRFQKLGPGSAAGRRWEAGTSHGWVGEGAAHLSPYCGKELYDLDVPGVLLCGLQEAYLDGAHDIHRRCRKGPSVFPSLQEHRQSRIASIHDPWGASATESSVGFPWFEQQPSKLRNHGSSRGFCFKGVATL